MDLTFFLILILPSQLFKWKLHRGSLNTFAIQTNKKRKKKKKLTSHYTTFLLYRIGVIYSKNEEIDSLIANFMFSQCQRDATKSLYIKQTFPKMVRLKKIVLLEGKHWNGQNETLKISKLILVDGEVLLSVFMTKLVVCFEKVFEVESLPWRCFRIRMGFKFECKVEKLNRLDVVFHCPIGYIYLYVHLCQHKQHK